MAEESDIFHALHTNESNCASGFKGKDGDVVLMRYFDSAHNPYDGSATKTDLREWAVPLTIKTINDFKGDEVDNLFDQSQSSLILFRHENQTHLPFNKVYEEAARKYKGKVKFQ